MSFQYLQDTCVGIVKKHDERGFTIVMDDNLTGEKDVEWTVEKIRAMRPTLENVEILEKLIEADEDGMEEFE